MRRMDMKKVLRVWMTAVLLLALSGTAFADVLWSPNNSFFEKHHEECTYHGQKYFANGQDGFVTLWSEPDGGLVVDQFTNGFEMQVYWLYEDWGCATVWGDEGTVEGWVAMEELGKVYDYLTFEADYADRIAPYGGEFAAYAGDDPEVIFYEYPGSPVIKRRMELAMHNGSVLTNLTGSKDSNSYISSVFVDENGLTWGYVGYMYGQLRGWFCLDDPDGTNFPLRDVVQDELIAPQDPVLPAKTYIPYALVGAAVLVTAGLLVIFFRKKKKA